MSIHETLLSSIKPPLHRYILYRGTVLGALGAVLLLFAGSQLDVERLEVWGIPLLIASIGLITLGLVPYRRIARQELNPDRLAIDSSRSFRYRFRGKDIFTVPFAAIESMRHLDKARDYGIAITLKALPPEKIVVHNNHFDMHAFQIKSQKRYGCDLFLPLFTARAYNRLSNCVNTNDEEEDS